MSDKINHPEHYGGADNPYEAINVIEAWGLGFLLGNVVKYISRAGKKESWITDLKKARWYLDRAISNLEEAKPGEIIPEVAKEDFFLGRPVTKYFSADPVGYYFAKQWLQANKLYYKLPFASTLDNHTNGVIKVANKMRTLLENLRAEYSIKMEEIEVLEKMGAMNFIPTDRTGKLHLVDDKRLSLARWMKERNVCLCDGCKNITFVPYYD